MAPFAGEVVETAFDGDARGNACLPRPLQASLAAEARGTGVAVHMASPGMVATDLLAASAENNPRAARILNILAEEPHTVARWLAPRMRVCRP